MHKTEWRLNLFILKVRLVGDLKSDTRSGENIYFACFWLWLLWTNVSKNCKERINDRCMIMFMYVQTWVCVCIRVCLHMFTIIIFLCIVTLFWVLYNVHIIKKNKTIQFYCIFVFYRLFWHWKYYLLDRKAMVHLFHLAKQSFTLNWSDLKNNFVVILWSWFNLTNKFYAIC